MKIRASRYLLERVSIVSKEPFIVTSSVLMTTIPEEIRNNRDFYSDEGMELPESIDIDSLPANYIEVI